MICPQCKKQIPDSSSQCPFCANHINHQEQVPKEIALRRYQRWFFYAIISMLFIGMILTIVKIYNVNTELTTSYFQAEQALKDRLAELNAAKSALDETETKKNELERLLGESQKEINLKAESYKEILFEKGKLEEKYNAALNDKDQASENIGDCESRLKQTDAMVYSMIVALGMGISNENLNKIPVADVNLSSGPDQDGDGLSDMAENAFGTKIDSVDTDGDGYSDKAEILGHFDPLGPGAWPRDENLVKALEGRILLQVERNGEAWYVSGGKKYFLGRPGDALKVLAEL